MSSVTRVGVEQFLDGDWPPGAELVDGEVVVADPSFEHQEIAARLLEALRAWTRAGAGRGRAGFGGNWVLGPDQTYKPDVWWVDEAQAARITGARSDVPPVLAVEVRSPGTWHVDIGRKLTTYEHGGVAELWLVDTPARSVIVLRRSGPAAPGFDVTEELDETTQLRTPLLEGFVLDIAALFAG